MTMDHSDSCMFIVHLQSEFPACETIVPVVWPVVSPAPGHCWRSVVPPMGQLLYANAVSYTSMRESWSPPIEAVIVESTSSMLGWAGSMANL